MDRSEHKYTAVIRTEGAAVRFTDRYDCALFSASLEADGESVTLRVEPKRELCFRELSVYDEPGIDGSEKYFLNGYQSWTDSREWTSGEKMRGIDHIPAVLVRKYNFDKYGDYNFARYSPRSGDLHGWTYAYIRRGSDFLLYGSLSEGCGFTKISLFSERKRVKLSRECEGAVYSQPFDAISCAVLRGSENEVFARWQELSGIPVSGAPQIRGYTSWYRHYQDISAEKLLHDLDALTASGMAADIFQIDDGYQTAVGDWLSTDEKKFPDGVAAIAEQIHSRGLKAGLWLAPFVCEKNSDLYELHPEWLLKDTDGSPLAAGCNWSGSFALDLGNEEVRDYLRNVFDTVLGKWGFDLVKLDFLYAACIRPSGGKSRGQLMCEAMDFLRELCGEKLILGCGVPLGAAFGKADYCRIGCDVGLSWDDSFVMRQTHRERVSTKNSLLNTVFRRQLRNFFGSDPDVFLLREDNISLSPAQKQTLAYLNHLFGSVLFTSDDVGTYSDAQKRLHLSAERLTAAEGAEADLNGSELTVRFSLEGRRRELRFDIAAGKRIK